MIAAVFLRREEQIWKRDISRVTVTLGLAVSVGRRAVLYGPLALDKVLARVGTGDKSTCATLFRINTVGAAALSAYLAPLVPYPTRTLSPDANCLG